MATMNRPAYLAIMEHSRKQPALIFVSSRRQTRLTALDLISFSAAADHTPTFDHPQQFLHMPQEGKFTSHLSLLVIHGPCLTD
jgi:activating signal cointegrator complex subunit 3